MKMKHFSASPSQLFHQPVQTKDNKAFMILSALGIIFVVDNHTGKSIGLLTQIFPYDSFFMPMFVFISGYFFSKTHITSWVAFLDYLAKKIQKSLAPFLFWVAFYGVLTSVLCYFNVLEIGKTTLRDLIYDLCTSGGSFAFNDSAWFVPLLFSVIITYCFIRKILCNHWNDYIAMIIFAISGAAVVYLSYLGLQIYVLLMPLKITFFLQFYHLGVLFRNKLERIFDSLSLMSLCGSAIIVNLLLLAVYGSNISFPMCATMRGFHCSNPFLPLITSITGITFWLKIAKLLVPVLGQNGTINFVSNHTAFIMTHHLLVKHIFISLLIALNYSGLSLFSTIDIQAFRTDAWYIFSDYKWCMVACFIFTVYGCVMLCKCWEIAKNKIAIKS